MYFVDREKMEKTLQYMEAKLQLFQSNSNWKSEVEQLALERIAHTIIEAILDVGNAMIDGFIMRDPGSYEDILDILTDEKVITEDMSKSLLKIILFRKVLVQQYIEIDHAVLLHTFTEGIPSLMDFPKKVREYLTNELGPVSAFKS
ncbi:DUF86 domain-containing protein [Bacillus sp. FJAT-49736]|uniref:DUF86 domain-containing protein n=1 Tax=Bacillus sp. FJAT-49736 TaxID=2833582 RepID=UPI001BC917D3|nr:DUF86 domain-containing protein [Bacillus sp. FJAT-49736]MBS4173946.1 DUF86 domain-containing protein [Bacillus sp. FJAT-49736]